MNSETESELNNCSVPKYHRQKRARVILQETSKTQ